MKKLILLLLSPALAFACDFPVPNFKIDEFTPATITKASFNAAMDKIEAVYGPLFAARGCPFVLHRSWSNGEVNAQAWQENGQCHVEMFGGFARYPRVTKNTMIQVACHEIGHHLGGPPLYTGDSMSVEGQADFYSTLDCMKRLGVPMTASSLVLAKVLAELGGEAVPSRLTRSKVVVRKTMEGHPPAQCRLDTFDAGKYVQSRPLCWYHP